MNGADIINCPYGKQVYCTPTSIPERLRFTCESTPLSKLKR